MNVRRNHLTELPEPIPDNPVAEQRITVLRRLAERLPPLAARVQIHVVGKGGTLLRLCEDTPRPSADYDCDTSTRWNDSAQAQAVRQALRNTPNVNDLVITEPRNRNHPVQFDWTSRLRDGSTARIDSYINTRIVPELADPDFRTKHVRVHEGITTYTSEQLYQTKANAFCNRCTARDLYDVWYGLSHHLDRIMPKTRIQLHERTNALTDADLSEWHEDVTTDKVLRNQVNADQMLMGIMECLETDPVIALHTHPERKLGFQIDRTNQTVAMGLQADDENPFHALVRLPQHRSAELADLALASRAPLWHAIGEPAPPTDLDGQRKLRFGLINHLLGTDEMPNPNEHMDRNQVPARLPGIKPRAPRRRPKTQRGPGTGQDKEPDR